MHRRAREFWCSIHPVTGRSPGRRFFTRASSVLMGTHDRGVNHHVFVVVITRQKLEYAPENATLRPPAEALIGHLPVPETLRQIAPGDPRSVSIKNRVDEQSIVGG